MIYVILFSGIIYLNSGQTLPTLTDNACSVDTDCDTQSLNAYEAFFGSNLGLSVPGAPDLTNLGSEAFVCSTTLGYCTG